MLGISGEAKPAGPSGAVGAAGPVAPVNPSGGGAPMTGAGRGTGKGEEKIKDALVAPTTLTYDQNQIEEDDW